MRRFGKLRTLLLSVLRKSSRSRSINRTSTEGEEASSGGLQEQLHWSEARRIYSEPASREFKVDRGSSASEESSASSSSLCGSAARRTDTARQNGRALAAAGKTDPGRRDESLDSQCCGESDGEDDDVFLQSWEETGATVAGSAANGEYVYIATCKWRLGY